MGGNFGFTIVKDFLREHWRTLVAAGLAGGVAYAAVTFSDTQGRFDLPGGSHPVRPPSVSFVDKGRRLLVRIFQETKDEDKQLRTGWKGTEWALYDLETPGKVERIAGGPGFFLPVPSSDYLVNSVLQYAWTTDKIEIRTARTGQLVEGSVRVASMPPFEVCASNEPCAASARIVPLDVCRLPLPSNWRASIPPFEVRASNSPCT